MPRDANHWEELHGLLWPFLMAGMYRSLHGNRYLAEEASQEVILRMVRSFEFDRSGTTVARFLNYLSSTSRSVLVDLSRNRGRRIVIEEGGASEERSAQAPATEPNPEEHAILLDMVEHLARELSARDREILSP